jgi:hypothetical protein
MEERRRIEEEGEEEIRRGKGEEREKEVGEKVSFYTTISCDVASNGPERNSCNSSVAEATCETFPYIRG